MVVYYILTSILLVCCIAIADVIMLVKYKAKNRQKIKVLTENINKKRKLDELRLNEKRIFNMIIFNSLFMITLRMPELVFTYNDLKYERMHNFNIYYYDTTKAIENFDFLFPLNGMFQFLAFYFFNKNFKENVRDSFKYKNTK